MKRTVSLWGIVTAVALLQAGEARAATDEQVFITELRERECRALRNSYGTTAGGFSSIPISQLPDGATPLPDMQPFRFAPDAYTRAARARICAEAEKLREALEWEQRQASSVEAIWDAVFIPIWNIATNEASRPNVRQKPSELTQRYESNFRKVLIGHPRSEREAFADLAYEAVTSYRASRAELLSQRICADAPSFETGEALADALSGIDAHVASLKEQLIDEVWSDVDPAMAEKLTAYAKTAQPTVWEASPAFFSDSTGEQLQRAIMNLCLSSRLLINPPAPRAQPPRSGRRE